MIKLSILIPYHNEPFEKIMPSFESINNQEDVDFNTIEIIISNNCAEPREPVEVYETFPTLKSHIKYVLCSDIDSIGLSRQNAIRCSSGNYFIFMDSDDILPTNNVLKTYLYIIDNSNFDIVYSIDSEELCNKTIRYEKGITPTNNVWISAKLYKKEFIIKNNITFIPTVQYSEDTLFNLSCLLHRPCLGTAEFVSYQHVYNPSSTSHSKPVEFLTQATTDFINGICWLIDENKGSEDKEVLFTTIKDFYDNFVYRIEYLCHIPVKDVANTIYLKKLLNM